MPRPAPRPAPPTGATAPAPAPAPTTHDVAPIPVPDDAKAVAEASTFGRVDAEGNVYVRETAGERVVGQFPGVPDEQALALYVRRYLDLQGKVALFEARLSQTDLSVREIDTTLAHLTEDLTEPAAVGDLETLRTRLESARTVAQEHHTRIDAERAAAKEEARPPTLRGSSGSPRAKSCAPCSTSGRGRSTTVRGSTGPPRTPSGSVSATRARRSTARGVTSSRSSSSATPVREPRRRPSSSRPSSS